MKFYSMLGIFVALYSFSGAFASLSKKWKGEKTDNPQEWVLSHAEFSEGGLTQFDCSRCSAMQDMLFIAATSECGNAGCSFYIFKNLGSSYGYVTRVFIHPLGFQFLKTKHYGLNDLLFCRHISAEGCTLRRFEFDGREYQSVGAARTIKNKDFTKVLRPEPVAQTYFSQELKRKN